LNEKVQYATVGVRPFGDVKAAKAETVSGDVLYPYQKKAGTGE
jgi:hypothetical protein